MEAKSASETIRDKISRLHEMCKGASNHPFNDRKDAALLNLGRIIYVLDTHMPGWDEGWDMEGKP